MKRILSIFSLVFLLAGCYCPCRSYSYNPKIHNATPVNQRPLPRVRTPIRDNDHYYLHPYNMYHRDYISPNPRHHKWEWGDDEVNDYPVTR